MPKLNKHLQSLPFALKFEDLLRCGSEQTKLHERHKTEEFPHVVGSRSRSNNMGNMR